MSRTEAFTAEFVELMPPALSEGVLYLSVTYSLTAHLCACGCGDKVVLPLHPQQWRFIYDGKSISLKPSVGNIGAPCNSHYWIKRGWVEWAPPITLAQARRGRARDRRDVAEAPSKDAHTEPPTDPRWRRAVLRLQKLFSRD